jgi:hypothetical protein
MFDKGHYESLGFERDSEEEFVAHSNSTVVILVISKHRNGKFVNRNVVHVSE